jgi:hypothetical protein
MGRWRKEQEWHWERDAVATRGAGAARELGWRGTGEMDRAVAWELGRWCEEQGRRGRCGSTGAGCRGAGRGGGVGNFLGYVMKDRVANRQLQAKQA